MPQYKEHLIGGGVAYIIALMVVGSLQPSWLNGIEWLGCSLLGSLFPDVDIKSKGQKLFYRSGFFIFLLMLMWRKITVCLVIAVVSFIPLLVNHRGLFHRLWFVLLCSFALPAYAYYFAPQYALLLFWDAFFFAAGAISHLWLDLGFRRMLRW